MHNLHKFFKWQHALGLILEIRSNFGLRSKITPKIRPKFGLRQKLIWTIRSDPQLHNAKLQLFTSNCYEIRLISWKKSLSYITRKQICKQEYCTDHEYWLVQKFNLNFSLICKFAVRVISLSLICLSSRTVSFRKILQDGDKDMNSFGSWEELRENYIESMCVRSKIHNI